MTKQEIEIDNQLVEDTVRDMLEGKLDEAPVTHTLLEMWREILSNIDTQERLKIPMAVAGRIIRNYPQMKMQEVPEYWKRYYTLLSELRDILNVEISSDPKCLSRVDDDMEANRHHYLNLIATWQVAIRAWEDDWEITAEDSHLWYAAIGDTINFVFGERGMMQQLPTLGFVYDDDAALEIEEIVSDLAENKEG